MGNVLALGLTCDSRYLWTLPLFHCNGWCQAWAVTAAGGLHVCLDRVEPGPILDAIATHAVTHLSCAPARPLHAARPRQGTAARAGARDHGGRGPDPLPCWRASRSSAST